MADVVKGARRYHSPRRQEQAAQTRAAILDAAEALFVRDGYAPTTMSAVAAEAGVALKTVYLAFETKSRLLRALWDLRLKGDQDDAGVEARAWYQELLGEPDPARKLRLVARNSVIVKRRIGDVLRVIRDAAPSDVDSGALWELIQTDFHANQRNIVATLDKKTLKRGLDVDTAADILWTFNHPDVGLLLHGRRGWTPEQFEQWLADSITAQLLR